MTDEAPIKINIWITSNEQYNDYKAHIDTIETPTLIATAESSNKYFELEIDKTSNNSPGVILRNFDIDDYDGFRDYNLVDSITDDSILTENETLEELAAYMMKLFL